VKARAGGAIVVDGGRGAEGVRRARAAVAGCLSTAARWQVRSAQALCARRAAHEHTSTARREHTARRHAATLWLRVLPP
jgi:hypothetical protein